MKRLDEGDILEISVFDDDSMLVVAQREVAADRPYLAQEGRNGAAVELRDQWRRIWNALQEQKPILEDLHLAGFQFRKLSDLPRNCTENLDIVRVLLIHFKEAYSDRIKEGIVICLCRQKAKVSALVIVDEFLAVYEDSNTSDYLRERIGFALGLILVKDHLPRLRKIISSENYGRARIPFLSVFIRLSKGQLIEDITAVMDQHHMGPESMAALGRSKNPKAIPIVEAYVDHKNSSIRSKARAAYKKLSKLGTT